MSIEKIDLLLKALCEDREPNWYKLETLSRDLVEVANRMLDHAKSKGMDEFLKNGRYVVSDLHSIFSSLAIDPEIKLAQNLWNALADRAKLQMAEAEGAR